MHLYFTYEHKYFTLNQVEIIFPATCAQHKLVLNLWKQIICKSALKSSVNLNQAVIQLSSPLNQGEIGLLFVCKLLASTFNSFNWPARYDDKVSAFSAFRKLCFGLRFKWKY